MSSEISEQLHQKKLQLTQGVLDSVAHNADMVAKTSEGESAALQLLANQLKETQEEVAVKTEMVLQAKIPAFDQIPLSVEAEESPKEVQSQVSVNEGLVEALGQAEKQAMMYKMELEKLRNTSVPLAEHRAVEAHLSTISRDSKQLATKNRDLEQELTRLQLAVSRPQPNQVAPSTGKQTPSFIDLPVDTKIEEEFRRLESIALADSDVKEALEKYRHKSDECLRLQKQLEEAKRMEKLAREDAQQLTWENGELKQQVVHLLHKYRESPKFELERIIAQPVTNGDLKVFGTYTLPKIQELTGVALHVPAQDQGAINFSAFSVDNIRQLVERCSELSKELWTRTQMADEHVPAAGGKRGRDLIDGPVNARPLPPTQRPVQLKREVSVQCEPMQILDEILSLDHTSTEIDESQRLELSFAGRRSQFVGRPSNYVSSEVVGAEKLVSAVVAASLRKEEFEAATVSCWKDEESHAKSALDDCLAYIEELEEKLLSTRVELENAELLNSELSTRLSSEASKNADLATIRDSCQDRLIQPLTAITQSHSAILDILKVADEEKGVATNSLAEASTTFHDMAESLTCQEEAMKNLLVASSQQQRENGQKTETLREEIVKVRKELSEEQHRSADYLSRVRNAEEREAKMAEQQWSIEVQLEEKEGELESLRKRLGSMLSPERASELESAIAQLEQAQQQLKTETEASSNALRSNWQDSESRLAQEQQSHAQTKISLDQTHSELENTQRNLRDAINDAASAQQEQQSLSAQLETSMNRETLANQAISRFEDELRAARQESLQLQGLRLAELSPEQTREFFPGDQAALASTELIHSLQSREGQLTRDYALAKQQIIQLQEKRDSLHDELRLLQSKSSLSEANNLKALCEARTAREVAETYADQCTAEANAANRRYQLVQDEVALLTQQKSELEAKIEVLASDPISSVVRKYGVKTTVDLQEQIEEIFMEKQELENELNAARKALEDNSAEIAGLRQEEKNLKDRVSELEVQGLRGNEQKEALEVELGQIREERGNLESRLQETTTSLTEAREAIECGEQDRRALTGELGTVKTEILRLGEMLQDEQQQKSSVQADFDQIRSELHAFQDSKRKSDDEHAHVLKDFETMTDDNMLLKQQVSHLTEALQELKAVGPGRSSGRATKQRGSLFSSLRNQ